MSEGTTRGAAEERSGAPATEEENNGPASSASTPGPSDVRAEGAAEEATGAEDWGGGSER